MQLCEPIRSTTQTVREVAAVTPQHDCEHSQLVRLDLLFDMPGWVQGRVLLCKQPTMAATQQQSCCLRYVNPSTSAAVLSSLSSRSCTMSGLTVTFRCTALCNTPSFALLLVWLLQFNRSWSWLLLDSEDGKGDALLLKLEQAVMCLLDASSSSQPIIVVHLQLLSPLVIPLLSCILSERVLVGLPFLLPTAPWLTGVSAWLNPSP